eukprot:Opistho-2@54385
MDDRADEPLLEAEERTPRKQGVLEKLKISPSSFRLGLLLVAVVLIGTTNRVTFKIMQYASINYSYFDSQFTTFMYIPISFIVIWIKIRFTNDITPEQRSFPQYKFAIMGFLDSMAGLLSVVGGRQVPGMMQNLLTQGVVPVTMLMSILCLRPRGCSTCRSARAFLQKHKVKFNEESLLPQECTDTECKSWVLINGTSVKGSDTRNLETLIAKELPSTLTYQATLYTSAKAWNKHFREFYTVPQYLGALIILCGLLVSVWPAVTGGNGAGPALWDMIFFTNTIPTALSSVYKEIAFRSVEDMDVWYLNGYVAVYQFIFGLPYAPLAAVMTDLKISDIPSNLWDGARCLFTGENFIVPSYLNATALILTNSSCLTMDPNCAGSNTCCDSCDGSYSAVSGVSALTGMILYMCANIAYNIVLVLVIKHGSAALMYVASTVVLPLGAASFTIKAFLGQHATSFTVYDGCGLGVVLLGLVIYRFLGSRGNKGDDQVTALGGINQLEVVVRSHQTYAKEEFKPRSRSRIRNDFYQRLGVRDIPINNTPYTGI